ncbi:PrgI family protein [Flavobacterium sp. LC2016-23]|uniref:PrgI family protein n=1 Tax=Flavobacterium sp. LC2016-23 TaxID=2666330 RepID=UPI0012B115BD|nr:PrgI family protein [Flavobacterium sp. LC2016-23]MRX39006.1 PrgI family protein [Flavobacterium sp. LC2016-23]
MSNFINPLLLGNTAELEQNTSKISAKQLVLAGVGSILIGAALKKTGHAKTGAFVAGLAIPLLTSAVYKKMKSKKLENVNKSTDITGNYYEH